VTGRQRVWSQPATLTVTESYLRAYWDIPDNQNLDDLDPQTLQDMVGEALLSDHWNVSLDEDWREEEPEPYPESGRCRCGHWLPESYRGHSRSFRTGTSPCRVCGCDEPAPEPPPPWVRDCDAVSQPGGGMRV
jgi:hypothetical protein